ncbi:MAG: hypothetical protein IPM92_16490 [Saprospiraceae bacterium]|nr:hypothetical protein [Saprospiraceae bacterium]
MSGKSLSQFVISYLKDKNSAQLLPLHLQNREYQCSSILRSKKAIQLNIAIMRAFVFIRQYALSHKDLTEKLKELETKYNKQFKDVYEALNYLLQKDKKQKEQQDRKRIGFKTGKDQ